MFVKESVEYFSSYVFIDMVKELMLKSDCICTENPKKITKYMNMFL